MAKTAIIANRVREVLLDGHWVAHTNFREQLLSLTWQQAIQKAGNLNTIAALTFHINYYLAGLIPVFNGGPLEIKDKYSFDLPPVTSKEDWEKLVHTFLQNAERFANEVEQMPDEQLDKAFAGEQYGTWLRNIEGVIEHCYYHLGQISLIKKLIYDTSF